MKNVTKILLIGLMLAFILFLHKIEAQGLAIAPINIEISNAVKGQEYEKMLVLYNPSETEGTYLLSVTGDSKDWIHFYLFEEHTEILKAISIPANDNRKLLVKINVPEDTPNGIYNSIIFAQQIPTQGEGSTMGIRVRSNVKINVGGVTETTTTTKPSETQTSIPLVETTIPSEIETTQPIEETVTETTNKTDSEKTDISIPTGEFISGFDPFIAVAVALIICGFLVGILIKSKFS